MKTKITAAVLFGTTWVASGVIAQTAAVGAPPVAVPSTPAPSFSAPAAQLSAPSQTIYASRLPTPQELSDGAAQQGLSIDRIEQSNAQVTVAFRFSDGQTKVVAYQLLPSAATSPTTPAPVVVPATPVPSSSPPVVYYAPAPRVIYYEPDYYYGPRWYPPVSVRLGLGFGYHGGGGFRYRH